MVHVELKTYETEKEAEGGAKSEETRTVIAGLQHIIPARIDKEI